MASRGKILLVDDDRDIRDSLRIILEANGYSVQTAVNGSEASKLLETELPDIMILDIMMSTDTEGFDLAHKLRRNEKYEKIPILMLTSFPQKMMEEGTEKFQHIMEEGWPVTQFFEKPIDPEELLSAVEAILREER